MVDTYDKVGAGVGLAGVGYGGYELWKSSKVRDNWAKVQADANTLKSLIDQYCIGVNEVIAKFDTSFSSGQPVDSADVSLEEAALADLEKQIDIVIKRIYIDIGKTEEATKLDKWAFIEGIMSDIDPDLCTLKKIALGGIGLYYTGKIVLPAGYGIYKFIKKIQDDHNDMNRPTGTSGPNPVTGEVVTGRTSEEFQINMQRSLQVTCVVNLPATLALLPTALSQFSTLPDWVQKQIAVEAGITEWYIQPTVPATHAAWSFHISANPRLIAAIVAAVAITAIFCIIVGPEILPLLQPYMGTLAMGMAAV
jgi:hypothetical protein